MARNLTADFGEAITGIGYQLKSSAGADIGSRVTSGIVNVATGVYRAAGVSEGASVGAYFDGTTSTGRTVGVYVPIDLEPMNVAQIAGQTANAAAAVTFPATIVGTGNLPSNFGILSISGEGEVFVANGTVNIASTQYDSLVSVIGEVAGAVPTAADVRAEMDSNSSQLAAILDSALKSQAAVYDSTSVTGSVLTLSNGQTQTVTNAGRVTSV